MPTTHRRRSIRSRSWCSVLAAAAVTIVAATRPASSAGPAGAPPIEWTNDLWAIRMLTTRRPLEEKLTLFWHGHFATGENKVRDYRMMLRQNEMFRAQAAGNLRGLLVGILKDPGMLVYLDNGENIKRHPNENFGRELLELFSMGVGNYTEPDVREAARAFTGWTNNVLEFRFDADQHDSGQKMFLGET